MLELIPSELILLSDGCYELVVIITINKLVVWITLSIIIIRIAVSVIDLRINISFDRRARELEVILVIRCCKARGYLYVLGVAVAEITIRIVIAVVVIVVSIEVIEGIPEMMLITA